MRSPLQRYRVMAYVTGVVLGTGVVVGIPLQIAGHLRLLVQILWTAHGYLYLVYCVTAVNLAINARWNIVKTLLVLAAGTVPGMSFVAEHKVVKDERGKGLVPERL